MGCLFAMFAGVFPRAADVILWIARPNMFLAPFDGNWWWPLLGLIFLPWTTLMYTIVWSAVGGVHGANWIAVALGVFLDLLSYSSKQAQKMWGQRGSATY